MKPYIHNVPGRLRVKIPGLKGDPERGRQATVLIETMDGVDTVTVTPLTGSVIVHYDPETAMPLRILDTDTVDGCPGNARKRGSPGGLIREHQKEKHFTPFFLPVIRKEGLSIAST